MLSESIRHAALYLIVLPLFAAAQDPVQEPPLALTAKDAGIKRGPCPDFMPKGCELAVVHGDPAKPNADVLFRVPPGSKIPRHRHTSAERMVLLSGNLTVTYDAQKPVTLKPGTYAYGPAKLAHAAVCAKGDAPYVLFIAFEAPVDALPAAD